MLARNRLIDVHLSTLKSNPINAISQLYPSLGENLIDESRDAMNEWLRAGKFRLGAHRHSIDDFGLSSEQVMQHPVVQAYCQQFDLI